MPYGFSPFGVGRPSSCHDRDVLRGLLEGIRGKTLLCFVSNLVISLDVAVILPLYLVGIAELSNLRLVGAD